MFAKTFGSALVILMGVATVALLGYMLGVRLHIWNAPNDGFWLF
jgi:hypothetical protein